MYDVFSVCAVIMFLVHVHVMSIARMCRWNISINKVICDLGDVLTIHSE